MPVLFNTDEGRRFTSEGFTGVLDRQRIGISMHGKGRWLDNVFVERPWRSVKYEAVCLHAYGDIATARRSPRTPSCSGRQKERRPRMYRLKKVVRGRRIRAFRLSRCQDRRRRYCMAAL